METLRRMKTCTDEEIYSELVRNGIERRVAARAVEFLPMAYCRELLHSSGARWSETFTRLLPSGAVSEPCDFNADPVWQTAVRLVRSEIQSGLGLESIQAVAARSPQYRAAQELISNGSELANIAFTSPILMWPEDGPSVRIETKRPWWRRW